MLTVVTVQGEISIPSEIRRRYSIDEGDKLVWLDDGQSIRVVPIPRDPLQALRCIGKGKKLLEKLLQARQEERGSK